MRRLVLALSAAVLPFICLAGLPAQMEHGSGAMAGHESMTHEAAVPSKALVVMWWDATTKTLSAEELKALPHVTVTVTNGHSHKRESYSGVPVKDVLALVAGTAANKRPEGAPRYSPRMAVVIAGATDNFTVALTLCDTDPGCRNGQAIVADAEDGKPMTADGAFKLIMTEDTMPGRWVRNLDRLAVVDLNLLP